MRTPIAAILLVLTLLATPAAAGEAPEPIPIDKLVRGRIVSLEEDMVEIHYDFTDEEQGKDWIGFKPFRAAGELKTSIVDGTLNLEGTGALHHRITFLRTVFVTCEFVPRTTRDLGAVVAEDAESEQYVLYCVNDLYFQKWDGGRTPGHMICRFGIKDPSEPEGNKVFRYVSRSTKPEIRSHAPLSIAFSKDGKDDAFTIGDREMKGVEMGREITELLAGFYVIKAQLAIRDVRIRGRISRMWRERENVKLELSAPLPDPEGPSPADQAARGTLERFRTGTATSDEVLEIVAEGAVSEEIRGEAAQLLVDSGHKPIVPKTLSLLYSEDLTTRELGILVVKGLTGKSFGYVAKAAEDRRSSAIQKLVKYVRTRPGEFGSSR